MNTCRKENDIADAVAFAQERFGSLHLLVNNAGIMGAMSSLDETTALDFERTLRVNLLSVFLGTKHAVRCERDGRPFLPPAAWKHQYNSLLRMMMSR